MNQTFLIGALVIALAAAVVPLAGLARPSTGQSSNVVPFTDLIGEPCTAWVGSHRAENSRYAKRVGGIWTADNGIVAVSGELRQVRDGWAHFVTSREEQVWVPLDRIIAIQPDAVVHVRRGDSVNGGPGIRLEQPGPDR